MNTHYTKDDVVDLATIIFTNDISGPRTCSEQTDILAGASIYAAEVFFNKAAAYHRGELDAMLDKCHGPVESVDQRKGERRQADRRGAGTTSPEEDEAFNAIERALKDQFLAATLHNIFHK